MDPLVSAKQRIDSGDLDAAEAVLKSAIEHSEGGAEALRLLGLIYVFRDAPAQGEVLIRRAIQLCDDADGQTALGDALQIQGCYDEAITAYRRALTERPDDAMLWCNLGLAHHALRSYPVAQEAYERALQCDDDYLGAWYNLGLLRYEKGEYEEAKAAYTEALRIDPAEPDVLNNLGNTELALGNQAAAVALYRRALCVRPADASMARNLELAVAGLDARHERVQDDDPGWWRDVGQALQRRGKREEAISAYRRALVLDPAEPTVLHMLAALTGEGEMRPPDAYVEALFDSYADRFEHHLVGQLGYQLPALIRWVCDGQLSLKPSRVLDLGCGTGLVGSELREISAWIVGVDLSAEMIAHSSAKGVYDALHQAEIVSWLTGENTQYGLIVAAEVPIYLGDMAPIFPLIHRCLEPGGRFIFSTERAEGVRVVLRESGRYAHSRAGIEQDAAAAGLTIELVGTMEIRRTRTGWEDGDLFVMRQV